MMKRIKLLILIFIFITPGLIAGCGVGNSSIIPPENDLKVVGDYVYQRNGEVETGTLVMDSQHRIRLIPDRSSASTYLSNWWFDIVCEYRNYRYLVGESPVYSRNDVVRIDFTIDYKQSIPLNQVPFLFARGYIQHRNMRDWSPLPGYSVQTGNLLLAPYGHLAFSVNYWVPPGVPHEDPYVYVFPFSSIRLIYNGGSFTMNLISGSAGMWLIDNNE